MGMKKFALSIKNPVSYLVCSGAKWIENRSWKTDYRGRIYIHSSGNENCTFTTFEPYAKGITSFVKKIEGEYGRFPSEKDIKKIVKDYGVERWNDFILYEDAQEFLAEFYTANYGAEWADVVKSMSDSQIRAFCKKRGFACKSFAIIGHVDLIDIIKDSRSIWAQNGFNWIFDNPVLYDRPVINVKGKVRLFDVSHINMPDD